MLYANLPQHVRDFDPLTHMKVLDAASVASERAAAIQAVFGQSTLPTLLPTMGQMLVGPGVMAPGWEFYSLASTPNLYFVQYADVALPFSITSRLTWFVPTAGRTPAACVIFHEGHLGPGSYGVHRSALVKAFIADGYVVCVIDMPFNGMNANSVVQSDVSGVGPCRMWAHNHLRLLEGGAVNPLSLFMLPICAAVNHCVANGINNVALMGLSGGGWSTTLYAALDTRVKRSYSVSGTMPRYLSGWNTQDDITEWEAYLPGLGLDYLDLYVLAAAGGRTHWQVGNVNDPACFAGTRQDCFKTQLATLAANIGGTFSVVYDTTATTHDISAWAINAIKTNIATQF